MLFFGQGRPSFFCLGFFVCAFGVSWCFCWLGVVGGVCWLVFCGVWCCVVCFFFGFGSLFVCVLCGCSSGIALVCVDWLVMRLFVRVVVFGGVSEFFILVMRLGCCGLFSGREVVCD